MPKKQQSEQNQSSWLLKCAVRCTNVFWLSLILWQIWMMDIVSLMPEQFISYIRDTPVLSWIPLFHTENHDGPLNYNALARFIVMFVIFGVHHSLFARRFMMDKMTDYLGSSLAERCAYIYGSTLLLIACLASVQFPIPIQGGIVWNIPKLSEHPSILVGISGQLFSIYFFIYGCWYLDGNGNGSLKNNRKLITDGMYGIVRHPLMSAMFGSLWLTPLMTMHRLVFAICGSIYIMIGLYFEEKKLMLIDFPNEYAEYRQRVPALIPGLNFCCQCKYCDCFTMVDQVCGVSSDDKSKLI